MLGQDHTSSPAERKELLVLGTTASLSLEIFLGYLPGEKLAKPRQKEKDVN